MKKVLYAMLIALLILTITATSVFAGGKPRKSAIGLAADRVVELQRADAGWEGTWYWYVGSTYNATNLTGATALGLLEAYRDTKEPAYLDAAIAASGFIEEHLGIGATGTQYWPRLTAADVVFLHRLSEVTGDSAYATRAILEWSNLTASYPTAAALDSLFRAINRPSTWDIAFFMEAAYLSGDTVWADDAAAIMANTSDTFYYGDTWWYALNLGGSIRALVNCGYAAQYSGAVVQMLNDLIALIDEDNGVGGYIQDTAYAVLAFSSVGGAANKYANDLGRWLAVQQADNGGWDEAGYEYPEVDGEALRALASTIGQNVTLDGFSYGSGMGLNSSWQRSETSKQAIPFNGE